MKNMKNFKKITLAIIIVLVLGILTSCTNIFPDGNGGLPTSTPDYGDPENPVVGLTLGENGTLLLDGKPVYAYGVNYFEPFVNKRMSDPNYDLDKPFKSLRDNNIRVIRACLGPFYESAFSYYIYSPDDYFEALDAVIAAAEKYEIGIFASLMWNFTNLPDWVGEKVPSIGDPESETVKLAKKYFTDVVSRYKDSPAIWAWEFGNEYNLGADLKAMENVVGTSMPGVVRSPADYYTTYDVSNFYREVGEEIRKIDPYRLIVGGDSELSCRPAALRNKNSWEADDYDDIVESTGYYAVDPLGAVSSHFYHSNHDGQNLPDYSDPETEKTYDKWLKWGIDAAKEKGKGYYVGEYGPGEALNNGKGSDELWDLCVRKLQDAFVRNGVQIALGWLCVDNFTAAEKLTGFYKGWFYSIKEINDTFKEEGLQDNIDSYWQKNRKTMDYDEIGHKLTDHFMMCGEPGVVLDASREYNGWQLTGKGSDISVTVSDDVLSDGSLGKVFKIVSNSSDSKATIKFSGVKRIEKEGKYKLTFYIKTSDLSGDGITAKLSSPEFFKETGIRSENEGEWTLLEYDVTGPGYSKSTCYFTITFEGQTGTVSLYGFSLSERE